MKIEVVNEKFNDENNTYELIMCAPGYNKDNMSVQVINNRLEVTFNETEYFQSNKFGTGEFRQKADKVKVNLNNGLVTITVSFKSPKESVISAIYE